MEKVVKMPHPLEGLVSHGDVSEVAENEGLVFDDVRTSILEAMRSIDVQACPGSGKTTLIATKLILLAKKWPLHHQGVCVLSHTNVAKDEIIDRLKRSKTVEAQRLLSYPHFIGTIQEFVGKYMAFPFIRSDGVSVKLVDTDNCVDLIYKRLQQKTRTYVDKKNQHRNVLYDFDLKVEGASFDINVPTFKKASNSVSFCDLRKTKKRMLAEGYFFYKDIYVFSELALGQNSTMEDSLRKRFPYMFLDEMQDTQKFQDEILCKAFPLDDPNLIVQRFGDPDQALFHDMGSDKPNESFNGKSKKSMNFVVHKSHRFDDVLARKIKPLSLNEIPLETELSGAALDARSEAHINGGNFEHTVIVFDDATRESIIEHFTEIVSSQFTVERKHSADFKVKVVGAVGNEIDPNNLTQLKIGHYWASYGKAKSKANFKAASLIEAARYCRKSRSADWAGNYKLLLDCILKLLRLADKQDAEGQDFSVASLREFLKDQREWENFRERIHSMLKDEFQVDQKFWEGITTVLTAIFGLANLSAEATAYLAFADDESTDEPEEEWPEGIRAIPQPENRAKHLDGFSLELSTIHGVKGETHDATLVLETKNHCFDMDVMLPYMGGDLPNYEHPNEQMPDKPNAQRAFKPNKVFMRQFYVAMSRPRHLLCLAVHADRISDSQKQSLRVSGWVVDELSA